MAQCWLLGELQEKLNLFSQHGFPIATPNVYKLLNSVNSSSSDSELSRK